MSKSKNDCNPFYVDVGTSILAIRCASNHDVIVTYDHVRFPYIVKLAEEICDRMNREAAIGKEEAERRIVRRPAEWEAVE